MWSIIINIIMAIVRSIFGTDKPTKTTVKHAEQEVKCGDGKTDADRLRDLGL